MKTRIFLAGYIFCSAIRSLYEDMLGKEKYMQMIDVAWVSWKYTVPIAFFMIIITCVVCYIEWTRS
ncbi:hypothetical protein KAR91_63775 [Candidatus Pacearchaeota archaeon]|nr:hypothetical protein [Candidatus Pacearchaeota archaeon]